MITPYAVEIRPIVPEAATQLVSLILAMAWESEGRALDENTLRAGVNAVFENPARGVYWGLYRQAQLIGCTLVTIEWSDWNNAPYWWIQSLYIQPEHRGQGLLEALLACLEAEALEQGVPELRLYVESHNVRAIRAYVRNGFEAGHYQCFLKPLGG